MQATQERPRWSRCAYAGRCNGILRGRKRRMYNTYRSNLLDNIAYYIYIYIEFTRGTRV